MELTVIGWTYYDNTEIAEGECDLAARTAIIADIRANGYRFSGWHHQETDNCTPVLSDGKMRTYSQRGWGDIMAEAWGNTGDMDYVRYAFHTDDEEPVIPPQERNIRHVLNES